MTYFLISSSFSSHLVYTFLYNLTILVYICSLCLLTWFNSCDLSRNKEVFLRQIKKMMYTKFLPKKSINLFIEYLFYFQLQINMFGFEITVVSLFAQFCFCYEHCVWKTHSMCKKMQIYILCTLFLIHFIFLQIFTHMKLQKFYCFQHWHKFGGF